MTVRFVSGRGNKTSGPFFYLNSQKINDLVHFRQNIQFFEKDRVNKNLQAYKIIKV